MYKRLNRNHKLSKRDINTINWLYSLSCGISTKEILQNYSLPDCSNLEELIELLEKDKNLKETSDYNLKLNIFKPSLKQQLYFGF